MLKFAQNEIQWADISDVSITADDSGVEVSVTVEETVLVVNVYPTAAQATSVKNLIEASKTAASFGGVLIEVIIESL